jgi:anthranilate/para-aminobenzoate synthase component II
LDPLEVLNRTHSFEGSNLFRVGLDASLGDNVSQQHASRHAKDTLFGVQFHPVGP